MDKVVKTGPGVFVAQNPVVTVDRSILTMLKHEAQATPLLRARLCMHLSGENALHEMLIVFCRQSYIAPHKHVDKSESFHVVEGCADIVLFDEEGSLTRVIRLADDGTGYFYYRLNCALYHTLLVHSGTLVIHETTNGPWNPEHTIHAPFAPLPDNLDAVNVYVQTLRDRCHECIPVSHV